MLSAVADSALACVETEGLRERLTVRLRSGGVCTGPSVQTLNFYVTGYLFAVSLYKCHVKADFENRTKKILNGEKKSKFPLTDANSIN